MLNHCVIHVPFVIRIRINKQLEVEPDEPPSPVESEGEGGQPKPPRRKPKRPRKEGSSLAEAMEDSVKNVDMTVEPVTLPPASSDILMVEVDNVQHEEFQITEEVKVPSPAVNTAKKIMAASSVDFIYFSQATGVFLSCNNQCCVEPDEH